MGMRHACLVLSTVLCAMTLVGAAVAKADAPAGDPAQAMVENGGFEDWQPAPDDLRKSMDCPQVPTRWTVQPDEDRKSFSVRRDAAEKRGGRSSVRVEMQHELPLGRAVDVRK